MFRSAPDPLTVFDETVAPAISPSVTALVEDKGILNAPETLTVPIGEVSGTPSSSTKRPKNVGLAAPNLLIAISSPASLVRIIRVLSVEVTATTPVSVDTLFRAIARFDKLVGVTSAEISMGTRLATSKSKETTPVL